MLLALEPIDQTAERGHRSQFHRPTGFQPPAGDTLT
jgi:hypothetical protein